MARVVGIAVSTNVLQIVLVEGDAAAFTVPFRDEWQLSAVHRADDYVQIRKRAVEHLGRWIPDVVCISAVESVSFRYATAAWFETAELRGVLQEAARASGCKTVLLGAKAVGAGLGTRTAKEYQKDNVFWEHLGKDFLKKYREAALVALSWIRAQ